MGPKKDWLLTGAVETDEKMAMDLAGPGYHINRSNLLVLESKADMQKRGQASPDDGDALALTFAQTGRFSARLFMTASYTWSKTLGINGGQSESGLRFYVPAQYYKNRVVVDFDRTHTFVTAAAYELPFGKRKKWARGGAPAAVLGGWQLNPSLALYSGTPFIVSSDGGSLDAPQNT